MRLLNEGKAAVGQTAGGGRIIIALEKIELALRCMIAFNYETYYGKEGREEYLEEFFRLCDKLGVAEFGEGKSIRKLRDKFEF